MGTGRFERLERGRDQKRGRDAEAPSESSVRASVTSRFGGPEAPPSTHASGRSGASDARFEEATPDGSIRVLETGEGQPFVRCAHCRSDSYLNATRCGQCDADLETPEQRSFNEALWRRTLAENELQEREVAALRERREQAEREQAEAHRQRPLLEAELARRRELGLPLDDQDAGADPLRAGARWLGALLGRTVARVLPTRGARRVALALLGLGLVAVFVRFPSLLWAPLWLALVLGGLAQRRRRRWFL